jgi:ArsR family transcriptional regulator, arsenate/arsenite/antimonite-responsive transcriptional repressor
MKTMDTIRLLKSLSDRSRLLIVSALAKRPGYVEELAERLNLAPSTVSFHLKKLEEVELVEQTRDQYYSMFQLRKEKLDQRLLDLIVIESPETTEQDVRLELYRRKVLKAFMPYGKVDKMPVQRKKRRIILDKIAECFEPGKNYTEKEVNLIIADFHDDFCTIRREMICEKIMQRDKGIYWLL